VWPPEPYAWSLSTGPVDDGITILIKYVLQRSDWTANGGSRKR
jgi:hypothetical protein